ncbi:peptide-N4-asparagine amidase [Frateuria sp. GZRe14]|uniref:peptide-N4-asparagine amidase n=1 Tax=Frateuria sp. GZRe14 TaxID=3351534 RepID=UPI003EDBFBF2
MKHTKIAGGFSLAALFLPFAPVTASPQTTDPVPVASVDPVVPAAAGIPCVAVLFRDQELFPSTTTGPGLNFAYTPPSGCSGPWAKVILKLDLSADRHVDTEAATLLLAGRPVFQGGMPDFPDSASWHAERDLTDLSSFLSKQHTGQLRAVLREDTWSGGTPLIGTARLFFYRSSRTTPSPRAADAIYHIVSDQSAGLLLPHNIVRAYLDVYNAAPWWFTCVPNTDAARWPLRTDASPGDDRSYSMQPVAQGCTGTSFDEVQVSVDGTPAGVAPYFPMVSADFNPFFKNTVNLPAPPLLTLSVTPYRVDLTPFAAVLNEAGAHTISLNGGMPVDAQLLLYQDKRSVRVSGAVTLNTLASNSIAPVVTDTLTAANDVVQGDITTALDRRFEIKGYVNTSRGRIHTDLTQDSHFRNVQNMRLDGIIWPYVRLYSQHVTLESTTRQRSRRTVNGSVLSDDEHVTNYPLTWNYDMNAKAAPGEFGDLIMYPTEGQVSVDQRRAEDSTQIRPGLRYESHLADQFTGVHARDLDAGTDDAWQSTVERRFWDNQGSCRYAFLATSGGHLVSTVQGSGCPNQVNTVRWFAHPDGSPDSLGWAH